MNPTHSEQPSLSLPVPSFEVVPASGSEQPQIVSAPELQPLPQAPPSLTLPSAAPTSDTGMTAIPQALTAASPMAVSSVSATPLTADDSDLIEKEWVDKAKAIVAASRDDPYRQTKEVNTVRADYMKKRYNRDIKVAED